MSVKRQATSELNHENWDQDDPSEHEEMGKFRAAPKEILEKRVIKTARRRNLAPPSEEPQKSIFSGFGGFNKTQPSSFDFLKNLTNGSKSNGSSSNIPDVTVSTPNLFGNKSSESSNSLFSASPSLTPTFGSLPKSNLTTSIGNTGITSAFMSAKNDLSTSTPFKIQTLTSEPKSTNASPNKSIAAISQPSSVFGLPATSTSTLFTNNTTTTSSKLQTFQKSTSNDQTKSNETSAASNELKKDSELSEHKLKYYTKLKSLNESVSEWIKKHVEETPLCILSPIFKDYEKHLKTIQDEFHEAENKVSSKPVETEISKIHTDNNVTQKESPFLQNNKSSMFSSNISTIKSSENNSLSKDEKLGFTFGIKPSTTTSTSSPGFSYGINTATNKTSGPFSLSTNTTNETSAPAPFSFGTGQPFSFNSTVQKAAEPSEKEGNNEDDDEPPKVEYTKIEEENSIFDKKCKVFIKKDGNFVDKGVGTLYIKKIEETGKHQLLVRANTSLGNILLNFVLSSGIPIQRMGKNNVMAVCIPTPDAKPPPTPILIRVKTAEEADELLETLNKYKA